MKGSTEDFKMTYQSGGLQHESPRIGSRFKSWLTRFILKLSNEKKEGTSCRGARGGNARQTASSI